MTTLGEASKGRTCINWMIYKLAPCHILTDLTVNNLYNTKLNTHQNGYIRSFSVFIGHRTSHYTGQVRLLNNLHSVLENKGVLLIIKTTVATCFSLYYPSDLLCMSLLTESRKRSPSVGHN